MFRGRLLEKKESLFEQGRRTGSFYIKNELKSEILYDKNKL